MSIHGNTKRGKKGTMTTKTDRKQRRKPEELAANHVVALSHKLREIRRQRVLITLDTDDSADAQNDQYHEAMDNLTKVDNYIDGNESTPVTPPDPEPSDD